MANHKISIPVKILIVSLLCFGISLVGVYLAGSITLVIWGIIMVLAFGTSICSAGTIILSMIAKSKGKPFLYFILTDILLILTAVIYGIYDLMTNTEGMLAGIFGYLLLHYAVPLLIGLGILSYLIARYRDKKKIQEHKDT